MNLYLSSFRVGERPDDLRRLATERRIGFVPNATDHLDAAAAEESNARSLSEVRALGLDVEVLDLRDHFGEPESLEDRLSGLGGVWVRGGNTFVLRQAMRASGFDRALLRRVDTDFLYGGYSAGVCVLAPSLEGIEGVDDPDVRPYPGVDPMWEGLGLLDDLILPHYRSDHPESPDIDGEVRRCIREGTPFRTLRDGEVIVLEGFRGGASGESLVLVEPTAQLRDSYLDLVKEFVARGEQLAPFPLKLDTTDFDAFLRRMAAAARGEDLRPGFVPHSTFWLIRGGAEVVGVSNLRHELTDSLRGEGGHIGYGVRPSARRRGYATELLRQTLVEARSLGIDRALVTCGKANVASVRTIMRNGGRLESEEHLPERGEVVQRYWIRCGGTAEGLA